LYVFPDDIDIMSCTFVISVNNNLSSFVPIPSCPLLFEPVEYNTLFAPNTTVWFLPADISMMFVIFVLVGIVTFVFVPNPNCPFSLYPNVYTSPFVVSNTLWLSPADIFPTVAGTSICVKIFVFPSVFPVCP